MERCNVLVLDNELGMGGAEKALYEYVARAQRDRFDIKVCCLKEGGYYKEPMRALGVPFYDRLLSHRFDAAAFWRLRRIIADEAIDVIFTYVHPNTVIFAYLARMLGLVKGFSVWFHATGALGGRRLVRPYLRPMLDEADALVAVAHAHRKYLSEKEGLPAGRIEVVYNGVDTARFRPGTARKGVRESLGIEGAQTVITTVASLKPVKRIDVFLRAAARAMAARPGLRAVIVGDGPDRAALEALAAELGVDGRVAFAGIRDDVDEVLRATDVFVLSSDSEAFPVSVLEAMSSAVPVVTTDAGSVRELVDDGRSGFIVPVADVNALSAAIATFADDRDRAGRFGAAGREIVESRFRIETMAREYERIIARPLIQEAVSAGGSAP